MSDSDSQSNSPSSSTGIPSDAVLETSLRDTVVKIFQDGDMDQLTVKRVRLATEKTLGLEEGFFKNDEAWKPRSDRVIRAEAEKQDALAEGKEAEPSSPVAAPKSAAAPPRKTKAPKRASATASQPARKRRRTSTPEESELSSPPSEESGKEESEEESEEEAPKPRKRAPPKKPSKPSKPSKPVKKAPPPKKVSSSSELSELSDESEQPAKSTPKKASEVAKQDESESEMSVVIDDEPKPKTKRQKPSASSPKASKKKAPAKDKAKEDDPDTAEIKRLQGWLVKCGIRKMWFRELAPYDTPKAKIRHLREMLKEAGMEGRFSLEKAKAIKEERELKEDLETVREGAKKWGTQHSSDEDGGGRPRRRVARGFQALDFLGSDGEETD
ncbi:hypothetical protein FQN51_002080 [Onygenales sp. PD_10]|nr:hypothetical protein FQN51_002080 [Onygenales sp. PD_10]